jgi:formamidopyrimidine-DNA glycosylase
MPELPEVETTRRGLEPHIVDQTIAKIVIRSPKLRWPIPQSIAKDLPGKKVLSITRRAKYLLVNFDSGTLIMHLGMSGRIQTLSQATEPQKHDHVDILFKNGNCLRYTDPRRFGAILWTTSPALEHELLNNLGPEPFDTEFNAKYMMAVARNKNVAVKKFIMESKVVVGIGNIYASEALFASCLHPLRSVKTITLAEWQTFVQHIQRILKQAIKKGGTTLKDFLDTSGKPGYFSQKLQVYGRAKEPCLRCDGAIEAVMVGQRNTFFCSHCQV